MPAMVQGRQITMEDQPRPFITSEGMAAPFRPSADAEAPTRRPLQRNALVWLGSAGALPHHSVRAGQEIHRVYAALTRCVGARVSAAYGERVDRGAEPDLPVGLRIACSDRYAPWREWAGRVAVTPAKSLADLTLLVCVDDLGLHQVADVMRVHHTTARRRLQVSLHWYCRQAGWLSERDS